jgi:ribose/xylose/arabinose/galactoside ABC-type transport system permease subunit
MRGAALLVTGGKQIVIREKIFMELGTGTLSGIPIPIIIMLVLFVFFYFLLYHTAFGRHVSAVGSNEYSARISGMNVDLVKIGVYWLVALTVTILGGTSLAGGRAIVALFIDGLRTRYLEAAKAEERIGQPAY